MSQEQEKTPDLSGYRSSFRLLGTCPNCTNEDTIIQLSIASGGEVVCENCQTSWPDWLNLTWEEKNKNNKLIPVGVERQCYSSQEYGVSLTWPSWDQEIPHCGLVASVLNAAVITKFKMDVNFATEGGICGTYEDEYIELANCHDSLGLVVDQSCRQGPRLSEVLDFYESMLRLTFEENFQVGEKEYRRGQILKLAPQDQTIEAVWKILTAVLVKTKDRQFAQEVVKKIVNTHPIALPYFRGLNSREIVDFFVPPPMSE